MEGTKKAGPKCAPVSLLIAEVKGWAAILSNMAKNGFNDFALKIKTADLIVCTSPLYFWTISAGIKVFIGQFYCIAWRILICLRTPYGNFLLKTVYFL